MTHLDLTSLTKEQLIVLLWKLKGTSSAYSIYQELRTRSPEVTIKFSDPNWEEKTDQALKHALGIATSSIRQA